MRVIIEKLDNFGRGITYINNKICFVIDALPLEDVEVEIIYENKKYMEARVVQYFKKSLFRVDKKCKYSSLCGGCDLIHLLFEKENEYKENKVRELVHKFHIDTEVKSIVYQDEYFYRNKIVLHKDGNNIGYYQKKSNSIVSIDSCLLVNKKINKLIEYIHNIDSIQGEILIRTSNDLLYSMISFSSNDDFDFSLLSMFDVIEYNKKIVTKEKYIVTNIGLKKYYLSLSSFFQVNIKLTEKLYDEVYNNIKILKPKTVLDLYCGTGTIGIYISDLVKSVVGIDNNPSNYYDAMNNKKLNKSNNVSFILDSVENVIDKFHNIDCIIVDPPRKGLDKKSLFEINRISPKSIIYVSCDIVTLMRDLSFFQDNYVVKYIKPFNMFPRTYHVETVSVLCRKTIEK